MAVLKAHNWPVFSADISDDGAWIVTSTAGNGDEGRIWRAQVRGLPVEDCHQTLAIQSASFSPDGKNLVMAGSNACVWDLATNAVVARFTEHQFGINSASFSPDGQYIVTASNDNTAAIWFANTGMPHKRLVGHQRNVVSAVFSPDGKRVLTGSWDMTARLWDAMSGAPLPVILTHPTWLGHAAFNADGSSILTIASKSIYLWDAVTGDPKGVFLNEREVNHAVFSPDGKYVAAATGGVTENSGHSTVVWDIAARKPIMTLPHEDYTRRVAFSPTGRHLVTSSDSVSVWDIESQTPIAVIPDRAIALEFSRDGTTLVTVAHGTVSLWPHFEKTQALVDFAKSAMARCLTPRERSIFKLDAAPPRWCITGTGREKEKDPAQWTGAWPYQGKEWKDWLLSKDGPEPRPLPGKATP